MHYIFSSLFPAVIKSDGKYLGDAFNKTVTVTTDENPFIEICPLCGYGRALNFIAGKDLLLSPPRDLKITDLKGGYLLTATPDYSSGEFKIFAQQKYPDCVVTVFFDNGVKISVETRTGFCAENLNIKTSAAKITREKENPDFVAVSFDCDLLCVFRLGAENPRKIFCDFVSRFDLQNGLNTTTMIKDMAKHRIESEWKLSGETLTEINRQVTAKKDLSLLCGKTLLYAFAEEYAVGGNYAFFLADGIRENAHKIKDYLGKIEGVMPPPFFIDCDAVGLIRKSGENLYTADYLFAETENGKITNLQIK